MKRNEKRGLSGYYLSTLLIGLGFFTLGLMDPLYDTYIPIFLGKYVDKNYIIGLIMTFDNVLAIFMIPLFSALSDRTVTRIGRRMPYIITMLPLTALFFALLPFSAMHSLMLLIGIIFALNFFKQAVRGPVVALMPDIVPADLRSEANGVINLMGGMASIIGTVLLARLMDVRVKLPWMEEASDNILAFPVASVLVIVAVVLLFIFVKENGGNKAEAEESEPIMESLKAIFCEKEKSALFILLSLLCWFIAYQGILPYVGKYSLEVLGTSKGTASLAAGMVGIAYAIFAIPSGRLGHKIGRRKTIRISLIGAVVVLSLVAFHGFTAMTVQSPMMLYIFWLLLFIFGIFWVAIVTNSFPMLWQMADYKTMGIYTGVYYFFSQLASIVSPPISGGVTDLWSYPALFIYGAIFMLIAFILMGFVHRGEPEENKK